VLFGNNNNNKNVGHAQVSLSLTRWWSLTLFVYISLPHVCDTNGPQSGNNGGSDLSLALVFAFALPLPLLCLALLGPQTPEQKGE
jgi:hypothetical protein